MEFVIFTMVPSSNRGYWFTQGDKFPSNYIQEAAFAFTLIFHMFNVLRNSFTLLDDLTIICCAFHFPFDNLWPFSKVVLVGYI